MLIQAPYAFPYPEPAELRDELRRTQLNELQVRAAFLTAEQWVTCVQGPPGCGKTALIIALAEIVDKYNRRVVPEMRMALCAPHTPE